MSSISLRIAELAVAFKNRGVVGFDLSDVTAAHGARELDALYDLELEDGTVLTLRNRVIIDDRPGAPRYALSHISVDAPEGPWAWLSRRIIVGTLHSKRPRHDAVVIRAFEATCQQVPDPAVR